MNGSPINWPRRLFRGKPSTPPVAPPVPVPIPVPVPEPQRERGQGISILLLFQGNCPLSSNRVNSSAIPRQGATLALNPTEPPRSEPQSQSQFQFQSQRGSQEVKWAADLIRGTPGWQEVVKKKSVRVKAHRGRRWLWKAEWGWRPTKEKEKG